MRSDTFSMADVMRNHCLIDTRHSLTRVGNYGDRRSASNTHSSENRVDDGWKEAPIFVINILNWQNHDRDPKLAPNSISV